MSEHHEKLRRHVALIAHELVGPGSLVAGNVEFARDELQQGRTRDAIEALDDASEGMKRIAKWVAELQRISRRGLAEGAAKPGSAGGVDA
ncbi:MAG: hypothetical protein RMA76_07750 [Deltaproteobacteria bacterium]|jgi:phosphoglycerate-specific signal transduction histidine kinase